MNKQIRYTSSKANEQFIDDLILRVVNFLMILVIIFSIFIIFKYPKTTNIPSDFYETYEAEKISIFSAILKLH